jgi:hypothetical protein
MSTQPVAKLYPCKECKQDLPIASFDRTVKYGKEPVETCKKCIKPPKRTPKLEFDDVPIATRRLLIVACSDRRQKLPTIAEKHDVKYVDLLKWIDEGKLVPPIIWG